MRGETTRQARKALDFSKRLAEKGWYHSFELPDGTKFEGTQSLEYLKSRYALFPLPADLQGKRVLDIGAWDGWFSFEAERHGAQVTAIDYEEIPNFLRVREALSSRVDYRVLDLYELPAAGLGTFDYVFFLGVLYHLKHPLLALEIVCSLTTELAIVESFVTDGATRQDHQEGIPVMEFYEADELAGQIDNWVGPTVGCLRALCRAAGFARIELLRTEEHNAMLACYRRWEPEPAQPLELAPQLLSVLHSKNYGLNFSTRRDEYMTWWLRTPHATLARDEVRLEVDGFGVPVIYLKYEGDGVWLVNSRLPPGLANGWKEARLRTARSGFSNALRIAVDIPAKTDALVLRGVCDGISWDRNEINIADTGFVTCWIQGLGENCDRNNVRLYLANCRLITKYIGEPDENGFRQVNAVAPGGVSKGAQPLTVRFGETSSNVVSIQVK